MYDLSNGKEAAEKNQPLSFSNTAFIENPTFAMDGQSIDVQEKGDRVTEIEVRSTSMSFCENPMSSIDFGTSNV